MSYTALDKFVIFDLGLVRPFHRFFTGWVVTSALVWTIQPVGMFENQIPRPWNVLASEKDVTAPTRVPWYLPGLAVGTALALFI
jgi:hypothetical protein